MKYVRAFIVGFFIVATAPALAQYQTPVHSVPVGKGLGNTGMSNAAPGTAGQALVSSGASNDPGFGIVGLSGGGLGASQAAATAGQVPVYSGGGLPAVPMSPAPINVTWFGVVADASTAYNATNAAANSAALTAAIATGQCVFFPYNVNGYSIPSNTLTIGTGQCIQNPANVLLKAQPGSNGWVFHITTFEVTAGPAALDNIHVDTTGASSGSTVFRFATASGVVAGVQLSRLLCTNAYECIGDETSASNYVVDVKMYDIRAEQTLGRQVYVKRSRGFMWLDTIRIDQTQAGQVTPVTWEGARFEDFIGLEINRFDAVGPVGTTYQSTQTGLVVNGTGSGQTSVWLNRILVDSSTGNGILLNNITNMQASWLEGYGNLGYAITMATILNANISNTFASGGSSLTGASVSQNNIACSPCNNVNFNGVFTSGATGHGISISGTSSGVAAVGVQSINNTGFGIVLAGSADNTLFDDGSVSGNTGGAVFNAASGTHNRVQNITGFNPVGLTAGVSTGVSASTITAGISPETHYITQSATFNAAVKSGATTLCTVATATVPCVIELGPNESYSVTWATTQPTYSKFIH